MFTSATTLSAVLLFSSLGCAAERLEARDPASGPAGNQVASSAIERPTDLQHTEQQLNTKEKPTPAPAPAPSTPGKKTPAPDAAKPYSCPMHPEVRSAQPGRCPKCGMDLVKDARP